MKQNKDLNDLDLDQKLRDEENNVRKIINQSTEITY
jgi:hypothetical protein